MTTTVPAHHSIEQVSDRQMARYAELIYARTGIVVSPRKTMLLSNRLRRRLRATEIPNFEQYLQHLERLPLRHPEWDAFIQEITTHETYLFRDETQWQWFRRVFLPQIVAEAQAGARPKRLRIWSAACSTGDEAVTAACCIAAGIPQCDRWNISVLGTDIGIGAIRDAKANVFGSRAMRLVPPAFRRRFFAEIEKNESWRALPIVTDMLAFRQHNLMEPLGERSFDLVLLKNVLIYFNKPSKTTVLRHVNTVLAPRGLLLTGTAEGVSDLLRHYQRITPWLFQKTDSRRTLP